MMALYQIPYVIITSMYSGYVMGEVVAILYFVRLCKSSRKFTLAQRMDHFTLSF